MLLMQVLGHAWEYPKAAFDIGIGAVVTVDRVDGASADIVLLQAHHVLSSSSAPHRCVPGFQGILEPIDLPCLIVADILISPGLTAVLLRSFIFLESTRPHPR